MADGDGAQSGAEGTQSGAGDTTTDAGDNTQTGTSTQSGADANAVADLERRAAEADSLRERMKAADQRASKFEQELKQFRDKDLPQAEKLQRDFQESQAQVVQLQEANRRMALENAFLKDNTYSWHNPDRALKLVDLSSVEIDGDGHVRGLKDVLKALATSDPYLIKQEVTEAPKTPPGTAPGNNGSSTAKQPNISAMASRVPALRSRVRPQ